MKQTKKFAVLGYNTINIGDDIQSYVASTIVKPSYIVMRDDYEKVYDFETGQRVELQEDIHLIMNGWFMHGIEGEGENVSFKMNDVKFPYANENIKPIFISTCLSKDCPELFEDNSIDYIKQHSPVLCRDKTTLNLLQEKGVDAEFCGCLTTSLDVEDVPDNETYEKEFSGKTLLVHGDDLFRLNQHMVAGSVISNQYRHDIKTLNPKERIEAAGDLLSKYKYVSKIYTTRLHCFLPARAMGIDVEFVTADGKDCYRTKDLINKKFTKGEVKNKLFQMGKYL